MHIRDRTLGIDIDLTNPTVWSNPYPMYTWLQQAAPLVRCRQPFIGQAWMATRFEDVSTVLKDNKRFKSRPRRADGRPPRFERLLPRVVRTFNQSMVTADDHDHRRLRSLVAKAFTPARIDLLEVRIEAITGELLDRAAARGGTFDLMDDFARPLPLRIISELLGVERHEQTYFHDAIQTLIADQSEWALLYQLPTYHGLYRFFERMFERKRAYPTDDLTSALIAVEQDHERLSPDELMSMVVLLLFAGHETTVNLIGNGTLALLEHPEQLERLRDDPSRIPSAIEEMLRYDSPAQFPATRFVAQTCTLGSARLEPGDKILPLLGAANRDPRAFEDPDAFDIGRAPNRHVAFGAGPHFCIGAHLSRFEGRIAFSRLLERFASLELAVDRPRLQWRTKVSGLRGLKALPVRATTSNR
ncbi:MAG: cytochrome P450 [Myxococcota bacterium]